MDRRESMKLIGGAAAGLVLPAAGKAAGGRDTRPNIIVVVVDDLRWDEFGVGGHPYLKTPNIDRLASEGALFSRAFHATPLCSPNRACILTGQYTATHAIYNNEDRSLLSYLLPTFPQDLQRAGYTTGLVGKWHMGNDPRPRPGFDYWVSFPGQGRILDPELFEDGRLQKVNGYITDLLTDRALAFIRAQRNARRPYFLYLAHKAVHPDAVQRDDGSIDVEYGMKYIAAPRHRGRYADAIFPRGGAERSFPRKGLGSAIVQRFLERKNSQEIVRKFGPLLDSGVSEQTIRDRAEMILSVDEGLGQLLVELKESGADENTVVLFTSDNGFFFGEHGLSIERRLPYEESIRAPLLLRYPSAASPGTVLEGLVSSVDIAPSVLQLAGVEVGRRIQGQSFLHLLGEPRSRTEDRSCVLIEHFSDDRPMPWVLDADYKAVRTARHKLIHWIHYPELDELYDLKTDPHEQQNLIQEPRNRQLVAVLRSNLATLIEQSISL